MKSRKIRSCWIILLLITLFSAVSSTVPATEAIPKAQQLDLLIQQQQALPRYMEAGYSPLGRAPVVDAVLENPFYLPVYAKTVVKQLRDVSQHNSFHDLYSATLVAGGVPLVSKSGDFAFMVPSSVPDAFIDSFGETAGTEIYSLWQTFIQVHGEAEALFSVLSSEEKQWLRDHHEAFFFGERQGDEYDFFTTDSPYPLQFFQLAARIDLAKVADCARKLSLIADYLYQHKAQFKALPYDQDFVWKEEGLTFLFSGRSGATYTQGADFFIGLHGNNTYLTNAGGTEGLRPAALHVDLHGHNAYIGDRFVQGCGFLGAGVLAVFEGDNTFKAKAYSQGAGFFGAGLLLCLGQHNRYEIDFGGQSFALFGSSLLWNKNGNSDYIAHEGMAQAASSTLGVAFLVDNQGGNVFQSGVPSRAGTRSSGIGQGSSIGVRSDPWEGSPSFYGGVAFLYNGGGNNTFTSSEFSQGSAYFLGTGILVDEGGSDEFNAEVASQGQGLHLAAGLLFKSGGHSRFRGGWGSLGVGGDRSVGMFINTGGDNTYQGTVQSIGTARKPKALGLFIDMGGSNAFDFGASSNANLQWPRTPGEWPAALFLAFGGGNSYPQNTDGLQRGTGLTWTVGGHSYGIDADMPIDGLEDRLMRKFSAVPLKSHGFNPIMGWEGNIAYRPLMPVNTQADIDLLVSEIRDADYNRRRQLYESIDLFRFTHPGLTIDLSALLESPETVPEDLINYGIQVNMQNNLAAHIDKVASALEKGLIPTAYARKMALKYIAKFGAEERVSIFSFTLAADPEEENRAYAALNLAKIPSPKALELLQPALKDSSEMVRYCAAAGLRDSPISGVLENILPLLRDESFYVRRAAAMTAISLHDQRGIPVLLETLQFPTLDTGENYGDNLYNMLAPYVGVNFGLDKEKWIAWWNEVKETFAFPP